MQERALGFGQIPISHHEYQPTLTKEDLLTDTRSEWQPLSVAMFPEGTIGFHIFNLIDPLYASKISKTHYLEGRKRSPKVFDRPIADLWVSNPPLSVTRDLAGISIRDLLLRQKDEVYDSIAAQSPTVERTISTYLRNLAISPAVLFVSDIVGSYTNGIFDPRPVPLAREELVQEEVDRVLDSLRQATYGRRGKDIPNIDRKVDMLIMRYGLRTGIPEGLETIASLFSIQKERMRQLIDVGIRYLRHPSYLQALKQVL